jgi:hypothetical protein
VLGNNFLFVHLLVYAAVAEEMDRLGGVGYSFFRLGLVVLDLGFVLVDKDL